MQITLRPTLAVLVLMGYCTNEEAEKIHDIVYPIVLRRSAEGKLDDFSMEQWTELIHVSLSNIRGYEV